MNSLREMMETTFAAAAFSERGLHQDAREMARAIRPGQAGQGKAKAQDKALRHRPTLNA